MNEQRIIEYVEEAARVNGRAFVQAPLSGTVRGTLVMLAQEAGMTAELSRKVDDRDLATLYAVARRAPASAALVASRITRKLGGVPSEERRSAPPETQSSGMSEGEVQRLISQATDGLRERVGDHSDAITGLRSLVRDLDENLSDQVQALVSEALSKVKPTELEVKLPSGDKVELGTVHFKTPAIIKAVSAGLNVYLHGPAGSGKTTVATKVAEALKVPFHFAAKVESEYLLLGFTDARGEAVRTPFREAYEHGGVFLFDEMDASAPQAIVAINAALANGVCPFPDGIVKRHKDFYCIGAGNTTLTGGNRQYTGRNQMDAASIDRFAFIEFPYDNALEMALASNKAWCLHVQAVRQVIAERAIPWLVTPRATIDGCKALDAGFSWEEAETMHIYKGLDADTVDQIKRAVPNPLLDAA